MSEKPLIGRREFLRQSGVAVTASSALASASSALFSPGCTPSRAPGGQDRAALRWQPSRILIGRNASVIERTCADDAAGLLSRATSRSIAVTVEDGRWQPSALPEATHQ